MKYLCTLLLCITLFLQSNDTQAQRKIISYSVQQGETLYSIAKQHGMSTANLQQLNNLTTDKIQLGQTISISVPLKIDTVATYFDPVATDADLVIHKVAKGQTLFSLAKVYGTTVANIMEMNGLEVGSLQIDQALTIAPNAASLTVKKGDTLMKYYRDLGVPTHSFRSVDILSLNPILLQVGQVLWYDLPENTTVTAEKKASSLSTIDNSLESSIEVGKDTVSKPK